MSRGGDVAYFAGGCFWGVEHLLQQQAGVLSAVSGYMGGSTGSPTYPEVCTGLTGHAETVRVEFDPARVSYERLARLFFEIHDPTQEGGQGPDIGDQYRSVVFVTGDEQRRVVERLIAALEARGLDVVTQVLDAGEFFPAEDYHQDYYVKTGKQPYCHVRIQRFGEE
ncbi:MAG: peptide-methionine (S)-S-oxide reductase MsrA [Deltaproteobacteria bacterium]|nr:peptide-methionine (S)-S-oxide reductase MsrA [Deltaproteobacteria bacterium]